MVLGSWFWVALPELLDQMSCRGPFHPQPLYDLVIFWQFQGQEVSAVQFLPEISIDPSEIYLQSMTFNVELSR